MPSFLRPWFVLVFACAAMGRAQPAYVFSTFAGQNTPPGSVDGPAASARFNGPTGVAVDAFGNIYVADTGNHTIRRITPTGIVSTFAGKAAEAGETDGANGLLNSPTQLAFDPDGNLRVLETYSARVRKISTAGLISTVVSGTGNAGFENYPVTQANLQNPRGLAIDSAGNMFLADTGNGMIRKVLTAGVVAPLAGSSRGAGATDPINGPGADARFNRPNGVALDAAGNVYIADTGNHLIRKLTPGGIVSTYAGVANVAGNTDGPGNTAQFNGPTSLVADVAGNLYLTDAGNHTIRKINTAGTVSTLAGLAGSYGGDDGIGNAARFTGPSGIALDGSGNLIVADTANNTIRRITPAGVVTTIAGRASIGSADGSAGDARFQFPAKVALDASGNLYVTDSENNTVRKITAAGVVSTLAGKSGSAGSTDGTGTDARFRAPTGIAVDASGNVYVADRENHIIRKITPAGNVTTLAGQAGSSGWVDGPPAAARFSGPSGVAVDRAGNVFVADTSNNRIRKITAGLVTTFAGSGIATDRDGTGTAATFASPSDVMIDRSDVLYVLDYDSIIRRITPDGVVTTYAGRPNTLGSEDGPIASAGFNHIAGIAVDPNGNLFLADQAMIREITAQGNVVTLGGRLGQYGLVDAVGGYARFAAPTGIAVDAAGNLTIADTGNALIRKGTPSATAGAPPIITNPTPAGQKVVAGSAATFQVTTAGSEPLVYQWFKDGVPVASGTAATLTLPGVTAASEGNYYVTVTNRAGVDASSPAFLSVYTPALSTFVIRHAATGGEFLWGIAAGNGRLVAVGTGGTIFTSADGRTWTRASSGTSDWLVGVTFGAGQFVAVGDHGRILTSPDGLNWSSGSNSGTTQRLNNVVYGGGEFVAVGEGGTIVTSTDARNWTPRSSGVTTWLRGLAYNAQEKYFALSGEKGVFRTSPDGVTWTAALSIETSADLEGVTAVTSHGTFVSVGQDGLAVNARRWYFAEWWDPSQRYYSWSWDQGTAGTNVRLRGIAEGANALFATGEHGVILTAPDTSGPWARLESGTNANLVSGVFFGNTLYIVGEDETILQSEPLYSSRLINISTRGQVTAASPLISGFVVTGTQPKQVLLRAAGPALGAFGVTGTLAAPTLTLYDSTQHPLVTNTGWSTNANAAAIAEAAMHVGAFPFAPNSGDSALLVMLMPGPFTAQVSASAGNEGIALVEAYDAEPLSNQGSRAVNISTRGFAGSGGNKLIAGFVIGGTASRRVLIRAVGPSLAPFGVTGTLAQPLLELYNSRGTVQQAAGPWSAQINAGEIRSAAMVAGAFALAENSNDAALVTTLAPGAWTVQVSGLNNTSGTVLLEVYDLP